MPMKTALSVSLSDSLPLICPGGVARAHRGGRASLLRDAAGGAQVGACGHVGPAHGGPDRACSAEGGVRRQQSEGKGKGKKQQGRTVVLLFPQNCTLQQYVFRVAAARLTSTQWHRLVWRFFPRCPPPPPPLNRTHASSASRRARKQLEEKERKAGDDLSNLRKEMQRQASEVDRLLRRSRRGREGKRPAGCLLAGSRHHATTKSRHQDEMHHSSRSSRMSSKVSTGGRTSAV